MRKPMRDRRQQKHDKIRGYEQMESKVSESAKRQMKHMPRYTVDTFMEKEGHDVKREITSE